MLWQDRGFRIYCFVLFSIYLGLGFYGTLWISDEFDMERSWFYGFFALPLAVLYFSQLWYRPHWWDCAPKKFWGLSILLAICFLWGNLLWINAVSGSQKAVVNITMDGAKYAITHRRGGFDWLYKPRW